MVYLYTYIYHKKVLYLFSQLPQATVPRGVKHLETLPGVSRAEALPSTSGQFCPVFRFGRFFFFGGGERKGDGIKIIPISRNKSNKCKMQIYLDLAGISVDGSSPVEILYQ